MLTLKKFERQRVTVTGTLKEEPVVEYGTKMVSRRISVRSIKRSEVPRSEIETLLGQLNVVPWRGVKNRCRPPCWDYALTDPMAKILQAGRSSQEVLLLHLSDPKIQDQIVLLLGGVGDERSIEPIIATMADAEQAKVEPEARRRNLIANLALTNLTVSEVIWHHGGGLIHDNCPDDPKACWSQWWNEHKKSFQVGVGGDRVYSNYPNYGIYAQFGDTSYE